MCMADGAWRASSVASRIAEGDRRRVSPGHSVDAGVRPFGQAAPLRVKSLIAHRYNRRPRTLLQGPRCPS
jgi:hypothetical protein